MVNGNHDMNMSYAAKFTDSGAEAAQRIEQDDWRTIFDGIGSADELDQKRADWRKLLESDAFTDKVRNTAFREIQNLTTNDYPTLASLLKNTSLVPRENGHEGEWFLKFDGDNLASLTR